MKRQHLWGVMVRGELVPDTYTTKSEAQQDVKMHKEIEIYDHTAKVVKLVVANGRKTSNRKQRNQQKKSGTKSRARKN